MNFIGLYFCNQKVMRKIGRSVLILFRLLSFFDVLEKLHPIDRVKKRIVYRVEFVVGRM
jgi:hypothetical protein